MCMLYVLGGTPSHDDDAGGSGCGAGGGGALASLALIFIMSPLFNAVVTGGTRGIGKAIAQRLALSGLRVLVVGRDKLLSNQVASSLPELTEQGHRGYECDVSNVMAVKDLFKEISHDVESLSVLVNAAGITHNSLILRQDDTTLHNIISTNLMGTYYCCRAASKLMLRGGGSILNIGSIVGSQGNVGQSAYSTSKSGLVGLTKSLALELGPRRVRVNMLEPGFIETDMTSGMAEKEKLTVIARTPLRRLGSVEDIAIAAHFLTVDATFVTGQVLRVDGGLTSLC